ncbi:MAG: TMEM175 family protein [Hyphomicrobium sp.]
MSSASPIDRTFSSERLAIFTDGVMAVAITVLVLDLKIPEGLSPDALNAALDGLWRSFLCYVLSFVVIGVLWIAHHGQFAHIKRADALLMWLNLLFLMAVALIPFVTSLMSDYGGARSTALYALVLMASCLLLAAEWWYAGRNSKLMAENVPAELRRAGVLTPLLVAAVFMASIGVAYLWGSTTAQWSWLLAAVAGPIAGRISRV